MAVDKEKRWWYSALGLMLIAVPLLFAANGVISMGERAKSNKAAYYAGIMKHSPIHQVCSLCDRPATHSQEYRVSMTGSADHTETYYFCDLHWPPPTSPSPLEVKDGFTNNGRFHTFGLALYGGFYGMMLFLVIGLHAQRMNAQSLAVAIFTLGCAALLWTWYFVAVLLGIS